MEGSAPQGDRWRCGICSADTGGSEHVHHTDSSSNKMQEEEEENKTKENYITQ